MIDNSLFKDKKAAYYTLGCKLNFSETSTIGRTLQEAGFRTVRRGEQADICVVNTCSVTEQADKKCRQAIHRLVKNHPGAFVVVTGCYAQLSAEKLAQEPGVGVVLGIDKKGEVLDYIIKNIEERIPYCRLNGHRTERLPNNVNFSFEYIEGEGMLAKAICHELDHLDGIVFVDKVTEYIEAE